MREHLRGILNDFNQEVAKNFLLGDISQKLFTSFPDNMPENIKKHWREEIQKLILRSKNPEEYNFKDFGFFLSLIHTIPSNGENADFEQVIFRKDLIYYISHLEGLFQDFYRVIYMEKPELLPEDREIKWKEITSKSNLNSLIECLIEKQLEKSGYDSLSQQILRLNNRPFLFKVELKKNLIEKLEEYVIIRNLIVHNGNKVNGIYLDKVKSPRFTLGEIVKLTRQDIVDIHMMSHVIAYETYAGICHSLFGMDKQSCYNDMSYKKNNYPEQWV